MRGEQFRSALMAGVLAGFKTRARAQAGSIRAPASAHDVTLCFNAFSGLQFWSTLYNNVYLYVGMEKFRGFGRGNRGGGMVDGCSR